MRKAKQEQRPQNAAPKVRSVWDDLFEPDEAAELKMRSHLMMALVAWLKDSGLTQARAAKALGLTQDRVSDLKRGKFNLFRLGILVRLAARAGLRPQLKLAA